MNTAIRNPRNVLALLVLATGALVVALAWPRLNASLLFLPVDTAIHRYFETRDIPVAQLPVLTRRAEAAIGVVDHYRYHDGLSVLHYLEALDASLPADERRAALDGARDSARSALAQAPAKPATWLRVATIEDALGRHGKRVVAPLELSMLTGRVEPTLLVPRIELAYRHLDGLDGGTRVLLRDQTMLAWTVARRDVLRSVNAGRLDLGAVRAILGPAGAAVVDEMEAGLDPAAR